MSEFWRWNQPAAAKAAATKATAATEAAATAAITTTIASSIATSAICVVPKAKKDVGMLLRSGTPVDRGGLKAPH